MITNVISSNHLNKNFYKIYNIHKIEMQYLIVELKYINELNINLYAKVFDFL